MLPQPVWIGAVCISIALSLPSSPPTSFYAQRAEDLSPRRLPSPPLFSPPGSTIVFLFGKPLFSPLLLSLLLLTISRGRGHRTRVCAGGCLFAPGLLSGEVSESAGHRWCRLHPGQRAERAACTPGCALCWEWTEERRQAAATEGGKRLRKRRPSDRVFGEVVAG